MNANELRIGNWVTVDTVFGRQVNIQIKQRDFNKDIGDFVPIPLTSDILLKIGFTRKRDGSYFWFEYNKLRKFQLITCDNHYGKQDKWFVGVQFKDAESCEWLDHKIKTLHQLQNLYFALTGTELKIDL